jgi:septation ring formation regulator EzrA
MTNDPPILTYTLEEVLTRFEQKMDKQFADVNQKMDKQFAEVNQKFAEVNQKLEKIDERLNKIEIGQAELSEKVSGIDKRLDSQEFVNRGVLVALIAALFSGAVKLFGWFPNS